MELFPGEALRPHDLTESGLQLESDEDINEKYVKGEVRIVTEQARYPLNSIPAMLESGDYELNPEFQRRHRWNTERRSRLIESFIMNVPVPPIFLYEDRYSHYEVMDGLQRLSAIREFYDDRFALEGLEQWSELNGRFYSNLPEQIRRGIDRRYLSSIILLQETAKSPAEAQRLKQLVFERINSGGIKLEPQESRNAIYDGPLNRLCIHLARTPALCAAWGIPLPTQQEVAGGPIPAELLENETYRKMEDVELVLRFFAYRQRLEYQRGALKDYLDTYLKHGNLFPEALLFQLSDLFVATIQLVYDTFGEKAFWLRRRRNNSWNWYSRPTTVVYDPLMYVFSAHIEQSEDIIQRRDLFRSRIVPFYEENYDRFEGRYTNLSNISDRNQLFADFVESVLSS